MPFVQLKRNWPTETFQRTVHCNDEPEQLQFTKEPREVTDAEWEELQQTAGTALELVKPLRAEHREKKREQAAEAPPQPQDTPVDAKTDKPDAKPAAKKPAAKKPKKPAAATA